MMASSPNLYAQSNQVSPSTDTANNAPVVEELLVTGQRQSLENAMELKRASDTVADSIVLDEAGKIPSTSLMEILERTPGVTMNRVRAGSEGSPDGFAFEGSGVQVRGLNKTKTLINGREVFSANGGSGLNWGDVGPELLKGVTVYKASRADLIEGGVSGTVDLQTRMPFDFDGFKANAALSGSYGDYSEDTTPAASGMMSTRFDTEIGEFGVLLGVAYSKIKSHDSNIIIPPYYATEYEGERVYVPGGIRYTQDQFERVRNGYYGAVQWAPNDNLQLFHTTFISERESDRHSQILALEPGAPVGVFSGAEFDNSIFVRGTISTTNLTSGLNVSPNSSFTPSFNRTADHSTGFKYDGEGWDLSGSYQFVKAESNSGKYSLGSTVLPAIVKTHMDVSGSRPYARFDTPLSTDPSQSGLSRINWLDMANEGEAHALQLDANFDLSGDFFKKIAVGGRIAEREESDSFVGTWWSATGRGWNPVMRPFVSTAPAEDFYLEDFSNFFKGDIPSLGSVWVGSNRVNSKDQFERVVNTYAACAPDLYYQCSNPEESYYIYGNPPNRSFDQLPSYYTTKHDTQSLHLMTGFANESDSWLLNFSGNFGIRWVNYDIESQGNFTFSGGARYYASLADARASIEAMGGMENVAAWQEANDGQPPLTRESVGYESDRYGSFSKDYFLPSFNIKFEPAEGWVMRYALTKTLTPPRYPDIRAQGSASIQTIENPINDELAAMYPGQDVSIPAIFSGYTNTSGNPFLKPEIALNHDLSFEWYPRKGSSVYLALFHKDIDNYVTFNNYSAAGNDFFAGSELPQSQLIDAGSSSFLDGPVSSRTNFNAQEDTVIRGFELGGQTYFDMLPGWLSGFGIDMNLTYIDNKAPDAFALDINGDELKVPVIGLSEWAYSTTLLYDWEKFSARLAWNWRDRYLTTTNDSGTTNVYTDPLNGQQVQFGMPVYAAASGRLDGSISYRLTDNINIKLDVQNITNEDQRTEMEILSGRFVDRAVFVTDRRIGLHLGINF